jgi:hypothetical protein
MNRQLKFRAWDKLEKRFIYPDKGYQGHYVLDLNGRFQNLQNGSGGDEYVVQQWTGEYDKNRKPIYEGDIISSYSAEFINENFEAEIVFIDAAFHAKVNEKDYRGVWSGKDIEVMGNIFQLPCNPDHNGECLVCDCWLSDCPFNKENKNENDKVIEIMGQKFNQHWADQLIDLCKTTSVISDEQISLDLPEKYKAEFEQFMRGKTCPMLDSGQSGVYSWDFEQYLKTVLRNLKNEQE